MVARYEVLVPAVQALEVFLGRDAGEFAAIAPVAVGAGQDEVPDAVEVGLRHHAAEHVWQEVVDVTEGHLCRCFLGIDAGVAVKAVALLVAVEGAPHGGDVAAAVLPSVCGDEPRRLVVGEAEQVRAHARLPGGLHEMPARFRLGDDVGRLRGLREAHHLVCEVNAPGAPLEVLGEEPYGHLHLVHRVEAVEHVREAGAQGLVYERVVGGSSVRVAHAGAHERARRVDRLAGRVSRVLHHVGRVGFCELLKGDGLVTILGEVEEALRECELVGGGVAAEEDDATEVCLRLRGRW